MYCKIHGDDENGKMNDTSFSFSSDSFTSALDKFSDNSHEIYLSSTQSIYFSKDVTKSEKEQIMVYFLNNTKYQSSVYLFSPSELNSTEASVLHEKALDVCKNEKINYFEKSMYSNALKKIRDGSIK